MMERDSPSQYRPPLDGGGLVQLRVTGRVPVPHVTLHSPYDQELHPPLTEQNKHIITTRTAKASLISLDKKLNFCLIMANTA